jgi:hypothetical protein
MDAKRGGKTRQPIHLIGGLTGSVGNLFPFGMGDDEPRLAVNLPGNLS